MSYTIRPLETYAEMLAVHQLQRQIWGFDNPDKGLYPPMLRTAANNGGVVLGAFNAAHDRMVGFVFGFLGKSPGGPLKLCSQTMGVLPEWRERGIALALKQAQRNMALAQDLPLVTWTFDPLAAPNAYLNMHKLRAVSGTYERNVYGHNLGTLNAGMPSDRLLVDWWLTGDRLSSPGLPFHEVMAHPAGLTVEGAGVARRVTHVNLNLDADLIHIEIPADIWAVKAHNLDLAQAWRQQTRAAFEAYLAREYIVVDFVSAIVNADGTEVSRTPRSWSESLGQTRERRGMYVLQKMSPGLLKHIGANT